MKDFFDISNDNACYPQVRLIQLRLNSIRSNYHCSWEELVPDGIYGPKTKKVVMEFQKQRGITPSTGILGPTTIGYIVAEDSKKFTGMSVNKGNAKMSFKKIYGISSKTIGNSYKINDMVSSDEKGLAFIFDKWKEVINRQSENLMRRSKNKFHGSRNRNILKELNVCGQFVENAKKYGINTAAVKLSGNLTKENAIKYIRDIATMIAESPLSKGLNTITKSFGKVKAIIKPFIDCLNKIPGLKYLSVIEKLVKATLNMLQCNFEEAFKLYMDALRELIEQIIVDAVVVAAVAAGGWIALVIAVVVIIGSMVIDYFFFSDNPGDSLADKYLDLKTRNVMQDNVAHGLFHLINE